jgi:hypothetical protein
VAGTRSSKDRNLLPRSERLGRFIAPAAGVLVAAVFWFIVAMLAKPFDGGALALWAAIMGIFIAPVCVVIALPLGLRLRSVRSGGVVGAVLYSVVALVPLAIGIARA